MIFTSKFFLIVFDEDDYNKLKKIMTSQESGKLMIKKPVSIQKKKKL